jgi:hypothetical protein
MANNPEEILAYHLSTQFKLCSDPTCMRTCLNLIAGAEKLFFNFDEYGRQSFFAYASKPPPEIFKVGPLQLGKRYRLNLSCYAPTSDSTTIFSLTFLAFNVRAEVFLPAWRFAFGRLERVLLASFSPLSFLIRSSKTSAGSSFGS